MTTGPNPLTAPEPRRAAARAEAIAAVSASFPSATILALPAVS